MTSETELQQHQCCFTGHRPEKLKEPETEIIAGLRREIISAIDDGFVTFISGMARGVDIWAAEIVLSLRSEYSSIRLICACPYEGFELQWKEEWQRRYKAILDNADTVEYISPRYSRSCFQTRNEWMVNHSARVIAVYNGESGGTRNTIVYAEKHGVDVRHVLKFKMEALKVSEL